MPYETKITCDICGKETVEMQRVQTYPSFFEVKDANKGLSVPVEGSTMLVRDAPRKPTFSTEGCVRPGLYVYLCREHFNTLKTTCGNWFNEAMESAGKTGTS